MAWPRYCAPDSSLYSPSKIVNLRMLGGNRIRQEYTAQSSRSRTSSCGWAPASLGRSCSSDSTLNLKSRSLSRSTLPSAAALAMRSRVRRLENSMVDDRHAFSGLLTILQRTASVFGPTASRRISVRVGNAAKCPPIRASQSISSPHPSRAPEPSTPARARRCPPAHRRLFPAGRR